MNNWTKEFDERIKQRDSRMFGYYKSVFQDGFEGGYPIEWNEEDKAFISKAIQAREKELIEAIEKLKVNYTIFGVDMRTAKGKTRDETLNEVINLITSSQDRKARE